MDLNSEDSVISWLRLGVATNSQTNYCIRQALALLQHPVKESEKEELAEVPPPSEPLLNKFSESIRTWRGDFTIQEIFIHFFKDRLIEGYEMEVSADDFKKKPHCEKIKVTGKMKRLKKAVKVLLSFCDSYPPPPPSDSSSLSEWQRQLEMIAEQAVKMMIEALPNPPRRITPAYLMKSTKVKEWERTKTPPKDAIHSRFFGYN